MRRGGKGAAGEGGQMRTAKGRQGCRAGGGDEMWGASLICCERQSLIPMSALVVTRPSLPPHLTCSLGMRARRLWSDWRAAAAQQEGRGG